MASAFPPTAQTMLLFKPEKPSHRKEKIYHGIFDESSMKNILSDFQAGSWIGKIIP
jgi:hypothetical protein